MHAFFKHRRVTAGRVVGRLLLATAVTLVALAVVVGVNTWWHNSHQLDVPAVTSTAVDGPAAAAHLTEAVRVRTVSSAANVQLSADQLRQLHAMLEARYPKVHAVLQREQVGDSALLYTWKGADPSLKPIMLVAHQDVVPIASGTEGDWTQPPFGGVVKDGMVWRRGVWDDKGNLILQMEAIELLAASGFKPRRTTHLAFGIDEEVGGERDVKRIAALFKSRGECPDFVIDEGLLITEGVLPGLAKPAALTGVIEKGFLSIQLKVGATPGCLSVPPSPGQSAIAVMSATLKRLDDDQLPVGIRGAAQEMFVTLVSETQGFSRVALPNLWLLGLLLQKQLEASGSSNAVLRTTTALTIMQAGNKDNVLSSRAEVIVNFRLLPGDTIAFITAYVEDAAKAAAPKGKFELTRLPGPSEASPVSPMRSMSYQLINKMVRELFPGTVVVPGLVIGAMDSRHMIEIANHVYRFSLVRVKPEDLSRLRGTNERITEANLMEPTRSYHRSVQQVAGA